MSQKMFFKVLNSTLLVYGFSIAKWKMQNYGFYLQWKKWRNKWSWQTREKGEGTAEIGGAIASIFFSLRALFFFDAIASPLKEIIHPSSRRCHMLRQ